MNDDVDDVMKLPREQDSELSEFRVILDAEQVSVERFPILKSCSSMHRAFDAFPRCTIGVSRLLIPCERLLSEGYILEVKIKGLFAEWNFCGISRGVAIPEVRVKNQFG